MDRPWYVEYLLKAAPVAMEWGLMLLPVGIYLLYLAFGVYRRGHPVVKSGVRNTVELALCVSGLLLLGPPTWPLSSLQRVGPVAYFIGYGCYLFVLAALLAWTLRRARREVLVLNVPHSDLGPLCAAAFREAGGIQILEQRRLALGREKDAWRVDFAPTWRSATLTQEHLDAAKLSQAAKLLLAAASDWSSGDLPASSFLGLLGGVFLLFAIQSFLLFQWYLASFEG